MSLPKLFNRIIFHNNTTPALNETNLNLMSKAVDDIDDRVVNIAGTVMETVPQIQEDIAEAVELLEDAEAITTHPPIIGQNGNWWTWDTSIDAYADSGIDAGVSLEIGQTQTLPAGSNATVTNSGTPTDPVLNFGIPRGVAGQNGQDGADGQDGVSPTVTIGEITGGHSVTITDAEHPSGQTFNVLNGVDGQDGQDGQDGVSPEVTIGTITGGHSVTITDADHPTGQTFNVMDGTNGQGVPASGTTGQVLTKASNADYDTTWTTPSGGSGGHTILNGSGTAQTQRTNLQFTSKVADDSGNDKTVVYSGSEETVTIGHTAGSGSNKWVTENNTIDGTVYPYKYAATLTKPVYGMPKVERVAAKGSGTTDASITAWNCVAYVGLDPDYPTTLNLYATAVPTVDFSILVKWEGGVV